MKAISVHFCRDVCSLFLVCGLSSSQGLYLSGVIGDRVNLRYVLCFGLCGSAVVVRQHRTSHWALKWTLSVCFSLNEVFDALTHCRSSCLARWLNGSTSTTSICTVASGCWTACCSRLFGPASWPWWATGLARRGEKNVILKPPVFVC